MTLWDFLSLYQRLTKRRFNGGGLLKADGVGGLWYWMMLVFSCACAHVSAATVHVAFTREQPPYVLPGGQGGVEIDLVRAALAVRGHQLEVTLLPRRRIESMRNSTEIDAVATLRAKTDTPHRYYSAPYITFQNVAITKASANLAISGWGDVIGRRVLAWSNARHDLGPAFTVVARSPGYEEYRQEQQNVVFWRDDSAVILIDRLIFNWYRRELKGRFDTDAAVDYHPLFGRGSDYTVVFRDRQLRDDFNAGLAELKRSGRYQQVMDRHLKPLETVSELIAK